MEPGIGRSLKEGFRTAGRSWAGMGFFTGAWLAVILVIGLAILLTRPPAEVFEEPAAVGAPPASLPADDADLAPAPAETAGGETNLFDELADAEETELPAPEALIPETAGPTADEQARIAGEWMGRAWPVLLLCVLLAIAANVWLTGGQIGYLSARVMAQPSGVSAFWRHGTKAFGRLLGGSLLALAGVGILALIVFVVGALMSALARIMPEWLVVVLSLLLGLAILAAIVWLIVRLSFWFIAIVVEGRGPVAGLKDSFRATRSRWWKLFGLGALLAAISYGIMLLLGLVDLAGQALGGASAGVLGFLSGLLSIAANLFLSFVGLAAYLRFYEDAKFPPRASPGPTVTA
jgi:hypothetical protein